MQNFAANLHKEYFYQLAQEYTESKHVKLKQIISLTFNRKLMINPVETEVVLVSEGMNEL